MNGKTAPGRCPAWKYGPLWLVWTCLACQQASDPTQTIVVVEADDTVRPLVRYLHVRAYSETDMVGYYDAPHIRAHSPMRLPIQPRGGDADRWVRVSVDAYGERDVLLLGAQARISFVANEKRYHHIWLSAACLELPPCADPDATCVAGECVSARVPIDALDATDCSLRGCRKPPPVEPSDVDAGPPPPQPSCGDCDRLPNVSGATRCIEGRCHFEQEACEAGHADCNGEPEDGCEAELSMPEHCGACGADCTGREQQCLAEQGGAHRCVLKPPPLPEATVREEAEKGMGCSDDTREGFTDANKFPDIAGCEAKWPLTSMRAAGTGVACGNSLGIQCKVPADACTSGWHVCATPPYGPKDVSDKATADECSNQPGMFAAAMADRRCDSCGAGAGHGAACCGVLCYQQGGDCLYPGATAWFYNGLWSPPVSCRAIEALYDNQGVLCCRGA